MLRSISEIVILGHAAKRIVGVWHSLKSQGQRFWSLAKELGLTGWIASSLMGGALGLVAWLHDRLPLSVMIGLGFFAFAAFAFAWRQFALANRITRFNPAKSKELGRELIEFTSGVMRAMSDWERHNPRAPAPADPRQAWETDRRRESDRAAVFKERYIAKAISYVATLNGLGIVPPFNVAAGLSSQARRPFHVPGCRRKFARSGTHRGGPIDERPSRAGPIQPPAIFPHFELVRSLVAICRLCDVAGLERMLTSNPREKILDKEGNFFFTSNTYMISGT